MEGRDDGGGGAPGVGAGVGAEALRPRSGGRWLPGAVGGSSRCEGTETVQVAAPVPGRIRLLQHGERAQGLPTARWQHHHPFVVQAQHPALHAPGGERPMGGGGGAEHRQRRGRERPDPTLPLCRLSVCVSVCMREREREIEGERRESRGRGTGPERGEGSERESSWRERWRA